MFPEFSMARDEEPYQYQLYAQKNGAGIISAYSSQMIIKIRLTKDIAPILAGVVLIFKFLEICATPLIGSIVAFTMSCRPSACVSVRFCSPFAARKQALVVQ
ncbi:hypothetical protein ACI68E_002639 [Malassezia pachydermatis]